MSRPEKLVSRNRRKVERERLSPCKRKIIVCKSKKAFKINHHFEGKIALVLGMMNVAQNVSVYIRKFW